MISNRFDMVNLSSADLISLLATISQRYFAENNDRSVSNAVVKEGLARRTVTKGSSEPGADATYSPLQKRDKQRYAGHRPPTSRRSNAFECREQ